MKIHLATAIRLGAVSVAVLAAAPANAQGERFFERVATYPVFQNLGADTDPATQTVAEIVTATPDGMMLVYTDSPGQGIGFIDIADPAAPSGAGRVELGGEPTSVAVAGTTVLAGVNTSASFTEPGGHVAVVSLDGQTIEATCDVGGQPDSVAVSPDGAYLAIAVENERDEDMDDGVIPQMPAGHMAVFELDGDGRPVNCDAATIVEMTGLADVAGDDPEPEFVDINADNKAVVSLQENNHLAIVDLATGEVEAHFAAGAADLEAIDANEDGIISGIDSLVGIAREPDAVAWLGTDRFATANEGDYEGGSRGFTIFNTSGAVEYESGSALEHLGMRIGHFPMARADAKGVEPEGVETGVFGDDTMIFVSSERGNFVAVYRDRGAGLAPDYVQALATNVAPEGVLAIPERDLLVVSSEEDVHDDSLRATVQIYARTATSKAYPQIVSETEDATGAPIGWGALSGMTAHPTDPTVVYAVNDNYYGQSRIYRIDVSETPARITGFLTLTKDGTPAGYDLEGVAIRADGGFWAVSEGVAEGDPNLLIAVDADGNVAEEIGLPEEISSQRTSSGFEGVASWSEEGEEKLIIAVQRAWKDDPEHHIKLAVYTPMTQEWGFVHYEADAPTSEMGGWVGLSEITHLGGSRFAVLERDNQPGIYATHKVVTTIDLSSVEPKPAGETYDVVGKTVAIDLLEHMRATNGWISDKPEGLAATTDGRLYLVVDNDGVEDAPGETQFIQLGETLALTQ